MTSSDALITTAINDYFFNMPFGQLLTIEPVAFGPGWCHSRMPVSQRNLQQTGLVHAGVHASIADQTAAAAAITLLPVNKTVVSLEFKINLLAPAQGERLHCEGIVIKPGRSVIVSEATVFACEKPDFTERLLVSKLTVTLYVVDKP